MIANISQWLATHHSFVIGIEVALLCVVTYLAVKAFLGMWDEG